LESKKRYGNPSRVLYSRDTKTSVPEISDIENLRSQGKAKRSFLVKNGSFTVDKYPSISTLGRD
jgi:hypothetical protein